MKRFLSMICAFAIIAHIAIYPTRSRAVELAAGAALTAVGFTTCVLAFLNAAKIYPYNPVEGTYEEWEESSLEGLISDYNSSPSGLLSPINGNTVRGYVAAGTICILHNSWTALRQFASWIVSKFGLSDNQNGVSLGGDFAYLPYFSSAPTAAQLRETGLFITEDDRTYAKLWVGGATDDVGAYLVENGANRYQITYVCTEQSGAYDTNQGTSDNEVITAVPIVALYNLPDSTFYYLQSKIVQDSGVNFFSAVPIVGSLAEAIEDYASHVANIDAFTLDTGEISIPEELPEDKAWGGLAVAGALAGIAGGLAEILKILQKGVGDRVKPAVTPVDVSIAEGTEVVDETGEVIQDVVISPDCVDFSPETFQLPDLTSVFPFSIPWDIIRVYQAFDSEPRRPEWHVDLIPTDTLYPGQPAFHVDIALPAQLSERFDEVAAMVRAFMLIIACIGLTIWLGKYIDF